MFRSLFIPSRSSRHRTAALALYRALLRTGKNIPLTADLQQGPVHPVVHLVRKRFGKNNHYTSLRLIYASMAAGYKFLTVFTRAQDTATAEHQEVLKYLETRSNKTASTRPDATALKPKRPHDPSLLTKVSKPGQPPKYVSTLRPRPQSAFHGERKIPHVVTTSDGIPFLRTKKPQPRVLSSSIRRKTNVFLGKVYKAIDIQDELMPEAEQEDKWDSLVQRQMREEGQSRHLNSDGPLETYHWSTYLSKVWLNQQVTASWKDFVARGNALQQIVDAERALALKEKGDGIESNVFDEAAVKQDPENELLRSSNQDDQPTQGNQVSPIPDADPFLSNQWAARVRREERRRQEGRKRGGQKDEPDDDLFDVSKWDIRPM